MFDLEKQIGLWRHHLQLRGSLSESDIDELESHLRDEMDDLKKSGLSDDEAFLLSVKRLGNIDMISREYSKVNTENVWKQLILVRAAHNYGEIALVTVLCLIAGTLTKLPELFGHEPFTEGGEIYIRNLALFILPFISFYFIWKLSAKKSVWLPVLIAVLASLLLVNLYPSNEPHLAN